MTSNTDNPSVARCVDMKKQEHQNNHLGRDMLGGNFWNNGLICAFEFIQSHERRIHSKCTLHKDSRQETFYEALSKQGPIHDVSPHKVKGNKSVESSPKMQSVDNVDNSGKSSHVQDLNPEQCQVREKVSRGYWIPIGWTRIFELVLTVQVDSGWSSQTITFQEDDDDVTVADVVGPYWELAVGPTWWCHVDASHSFIKSWLIEAKWLHPAISIALRDESRLISERMKFLLYEVPVNVAGGLLFELLGQSAGDPYVDEDDIPVVLRSWHAQNFLVTALHVKGSASNINVLGIAEVQELLVAGGNNLPRTIHDVIAHLASRLAKWDDRLFRKSIFGAADEIELKFMNRRTHEDMHLFSVILNQEIRKLSTQVIRVKWSLHAREEIVYELLQHMRGDLARCLLEGMRKSSREMIEEQEAVRGRLFTIQDVMQSTVRAWLQDKSLRVTHNLGVFGGCGLVLSIITGLFGINVDGIPGANNTPYAFALFSCILFLLGAALIATGLLYLGLKKPIAEEQVEVRKMELQELVNIFQREAESHAQVRKAVPRSNLSPTAADLLSDGGAYILINEH